MILGSGYLFLDFWLLLFLSTVISFLGVYRPQPVYWRGNHGSQSLSLGSSQYGDSQLIPPMYGPEGEFGTESEGDPDVEYLQPISMRSRKPYSRKYSEKSIE